MNRERLFIALFAMIGLGLTGCASPLSQGEVRETAFALVTQQAEAASADLNETSTELPESNLTPRGPVIEVDCSNQAIDEWYNAINSDLEVLMEEFQWIQVGDPLDEVPAKLEAAKAREETLKQLAAPDCANELFAYYLELYGEYTGMYERALAEDWGPFLDHRRAFRFRLQSFEAAFTALKE